MDLRDLFFRLAAALAIGLLIGTARALAPGSLIFQALRGMVWFRSRKIAFPTMKITGGRHGPCSEMVVTCGVDNVHRERQRGACVGHPAAVRQGARESQGEVYGLA